MSKVYEVVMPETDEEIFGVLQDFDEILSRIYKGKKMPEEIGIIQDVIGEVMQDILQKDAIEMSKESE